MPTQKLTHAELWTLSQGIAIGEAVDAVCPLCGPQCRTKINAKRPVLRIWRPKEKILTYKCARCEAKGWDAGNASGTFPPRAARTTATQIDRGKLARELWERAVPITGTPAQKYLERRGCFIDSANLRFLRGSRNHPHAMLARFSSRDGSTNAIHMTHIDIDGSKADVAKVKIMLGKSAGWPIIVSDGGGATDALYVAEGIEDAASLALATGGAAWAAGSAGRIATCLRRARNYAKVFVATDPDTAGERALMAARKTRPGLISVNFSIDGDEMDANATLCRYGIGAVSQCIEFAQKGMAA
jgi:hypothetical protein